VAIRPYNIDPLTIKKPMICTMGYPERISLNKIDLFRLMHQLFSSGNKKSVTLILRSFQTEVLA
jgi:hypothetical protein